MAWQLRPARPDDADACHDVSRAGFATYGEFAGAGFRMPYEATAADIAGRLAAGWGVVAEEEEEEGEIVAFGAFEPARETVREGPHVPGLAHVWAVFVRPPHWGSGVAGEVHHALVAEMARQGFAEARLHTPAQHARARRFYEREGWVVRGTPFAAPDLGLELVELRRPL